jgi:hypothetical protein
MAGAIWSVGGAIVIFVVSGDAILAFLSGVGLFLLTRVRRASARSEASFADGFLPYRSDMALPRGVQEDDDFRWNWSHQTDASARDGNSGS